MTDYSKYSIEELENLKNLTQARINDGVETRNAIMKEIELKTVAAQKFAVGDIYGRVYGANTFLIIRDIKSQYIKCIEVSLDYSNYDENIDRGIVFCDETITASELSNEKYYYKMEKDAFIEYYKNASLEALNDVLKFCK